MNMATDLARNTAPHTTNLGSTPATNRGTNHGTMGVVSANMTALASPVGAIDGLTRRVESASQRQPSSTAPVGQPTALPAKPEVSSMYSPISFAFFGLTGTAVGAAGITGSFGGLTSLVVTVAVLAVLFAAVLAARAVARRRLNP
jgi:hypothetical protein